MRFVYSKWNDEFMQKIRNMRDLLSIFNYILLQVNGDVDKAFKVMEKLQQMGYLPEEFDLEAFKKELLDRKIIALDQNTPALTRKGERGLRREAFDRVFQQLKSSGMGNHPTPLGSGYSEEILPEKRPYDFGDDLLNLDLTGSMLNTISRTGSLGMEMTHDDLEVYDTSRTTNCATVVLIDISHSMILYGEDRITPAKQVALAFTELITSKYPKDSLNIVLFGDTAEEIKIEDLPYVGVGPYHTNTKAGLQKARQILLRKKSINKQIFMITDGKPSMITKSNGRAYKNPVGLDPMIVNRTLDEAVVCRKKKITITTFMIAEDPYLQEFVKKLTELNRGRAYFSSPDNLGNYIFWDFMNNRKRQR
ncbi:conserved hypothetical protein [Candidatus Zixiibacteriota bacterium]|nr:conserved hypothetical protein [candidate division Zixibacteria bacterium]